MQHIMRSLVLLTAYHAPFHAPGLATAFVQTRGVSTTPRHRQPLPLSVTERINLAARRPAPVNSRTVTMAGPGVRAGLRAAIGLVPRLKTPTAAAVAVVAAAAGGLLTKRLLDTPSRTYDGDANSVGREYDAWTEEGILEYYWGEHIHLGHYSKEEMAAGYKKKDFIQAKYDFIDEMMAWGGVATGPGAAPSKILDCGCGIGGTSRYLGKALPAGSSVTGITLSPKQVERGTALIEERGLTGVVDMRVMNALAMEFPDETFDLVWACESGEHMPDKRKYIEEMTRVLKPGGKLVVATWCQRDDEPPAAQFTAKERRDLDYLYSEWTHPYFISKEAYRGLALDTGAYDGVEVADWKEQTIASWRHSVWVGAWDPLPVVRAGPKVWYKTVRDIVCLERFHRAMDRGLMEYGMLRATKQAAPPAAPPAAPAATALAGPPSWNTPPSWERVTSN